MGNGAELREGSARSTEMGTVAEGDRWGSAAWAGGVVRRPFSSA